MNRTSSADSMKEELLTGWSNRETVDEAKKQGKEDGMSKKRMSPNYLEYAGTGDNEIAEAYSKAYKEGREAIYKATGSKRRKTKKHARKIRRTRKVNGRKH